MKFHSKFFASRQSRQIFSLLLVLFTVCTLASKNFAQDESSQSDPVKLFEQGQDAHEKGDFQTAIKFYDEALKANPEFPEAEYQRGSALVSLGQTTEAEKSFRRAIELREDWTLPMTALGSLLIEENKFDESEKLLTKVLELDEKNSGAATALAELYLRTKTSPEILKTFLAKLQNLTAQNNASASLWAARGAVELKLQDQSAAQNSLNKALTLNPNDQFTLSALTEAFLNAKNYPAATATAEKFIKVAPNSTSAKILLARVYAQTEKTSDALKILDSLDQSNPNVVALKNSLSINNSQDTATLEKQLENEPKNVDLLSRLCVLSRVSNPQKALDYCRRASELEPNNLNHYIAYGAALVQAKQFDNAISLFRKVLQVAPDNYTAHANLATAFSETKNYQAAVTEYEWLAKAKPDLAITYYLLAIAHDQLQEYPEALENYRKFLSLADNKQNQLEIDKVNLRLPAVEKLAKQKGKK